MSLLDTNIPYAKLSRAFYQNAKKLSGTDHLVFGFIATYRNEKTGWAWPSVLTMSNGLGISGRQVRRSLRRLEKFGYLTPTGKHHGRGTVEYFINTGMPTAHGTPLPTITIQNEQVSPNIDLIGRQIESSRGDNSGTKWGTILAPNGGQICPPNALRNSEVKQHEPQLKKSGKNLGKVVVVPLANSFEMQHPQNMFEERDTIIQELQGRLDALETQMSMVPDNENKNPIQSIEKPSKQLFFPTQFEITPSIQAPSPIPTMEISNETTIPSVAPIVATLMALMPKKLKQKDQDSILRRVMGLEQETAREVLKVLGEAIDGGGVRSPNGYLTGILRNVSNGTFTESNATRSARGKAEDEEKEKQALEKKIQKEVKEKQDEEESESKKQHVDTFLESLSEEKRDGIKREFLKTFKPGHIVLEMVKKQGFDSLLVAGMFRSFVFENYLTDVSSKPNPSTEGFEPMIPKPTAPKEVKLSKPTPIRTNLKDNNGDGHPDQSRNIMEKGSKWDRRVFETETARLEEEGLEAKRQEMIRQLRRM